MELWFSSALIGALLAGVSNFTFKIAAKRHYNSSLFSLYGGIMAIVMIMVALLFHSESLSDYGAIKWMSLLGGVIAAITGILKIPALKYIDSTIYFPLFKLLAPALAIVSGILIFSETFNIHEWTGMLLSLFVPLLLITRAENGRQNNLMLGLGLVLVTGLLSATSATLYKLVMDAGVPVLVALFYSAFGILLGSLLSILYAHGLRSFVRTIKEQTSRKLVFWGALRAALITIGFGFILHAYALGGTLAIVQTIHSLYILIPIVLAIIIYDEHWNFQKAVAIVMSVAALSLMG
jgi:drug/metabolite transporter (DMT)-like permease